jgi:hypothetical protein
VDLSSLSGKRKETEASLNVIKSKKGFIKMVKH